MQMMQTNGVDNFATLVGRDFTNEQANTTGNTKPSNCNCITYNSFSQESKACVSIRIQIPTTLHRMFVLLKMSGITLEL